MTPRARRLQEAADAASTWFGREVTPDQLTSRGNRPRLCQPRQYAAAYLRWKHGNGECTMPRLARLLGYNDHTTILHAVRVAHKRWPRAIFVQGFPPHLESLIRSEREREILERNVRTELRLAELEAAA